MNRVVLILTLAMTASTFAASYAVDQGSVSLGGSAGLSGYTSLNSSGFSGSLWFGPDVDFFVLPRFSLGAGLNLELGVSKGTGDASVSYGAGISPRLGLYAGSEGGRTFPFVRLGLGASYSKYPAWDYKSVGGALALGVVLMISENVGLCPGLYLSYSNSLSGGSKGSLNAGLSIGVENFVFRQ